ncbi:MAG: cyclic nucleotide-binding domain-containing protein [Actinobacteria bacterium]|nr:cyclic nucleotide-binding domain-containing protein [Actinomycetota bacterium]
MGWRKDRHPHMDALEAVQLFEGVDEKHLRAVAERAQSLSVREGELLMLERFHGEQFLIILEGSASVRHGSQEIATVGPGDFLGEIGLLQHEDRTATVVARSRMKLLAIDEEDFQKFLRDIPEVAQRVRREAALRLAANESESD